MQNSYHYFVSAFVTSSLSLMTALSSAGYSWRPPSSLVLITVWPHEQCCPTMQLTILQIGNTLTLSCQELTLTTNGKRGKQFKWHTVIRTGPMPLQVSTTTWRKSSSLGSVVQTLDPVYLGLNSVSSAVTVLSPVTTDRRLQYLENKTKQTSSWYKLRNAEHAQLSGIAYLLLYKVLGSHILKSWMQHNTTTTCN